MNPQIAISSFWPVHSDLVSKIGTTAPGYEIVDISANPTNEELANCEILFGSKGADIIHKMPNLKWIHAETAGVDMYLDPKLALPTDIILTNSSGAYGISIAEHMLNFTLMLLRGSAGYFEQQRTHTWKPMGGARNIYNCNVTVIGMGDIGGRYAQLCHAMGATVSGVVRSPRNNRPAYVDKLFTTDQLDDALLNADVVALALPGTGETAGILSRARLASMKKGAVIVNVGRGSAIDQDAMIELLQTGHIGGAGLDVTSPEPLPDDSPLWDLPNVIITPHVSHGGRDNTAGLIFEKFARYLDDYIHGRPLERVVDRSVGY